MESEDVVFDSRRTFFSAWCALHIVRLVHHVMFVYHGAYVGVMANCSCALCFRPGEAVDVDVGLNQVWMRRL